MRMMYAVALTAAASVGLATTFNASRAVLPSDPAAPVVGRYRILPVAAGGQLLLIDTTTADVWSRWPNRDWEKYANPVKGQH